MVGLRQPRPEEKAASYFAHYTLILEALPTTMLVASSTRRREIASGV